jgi:hypothetical protein
MGKIMGMKRQAPVLWRVIIALSLYFKIIQYVKC